MILLALDTCDSRGSLAVLREAEVLQVLPHEGTVDYSSWLLPNAEAALSACGFGMRDVETLAVALGPGSFTGVRVGLTTVKAWNEVYGTRIAGVSRLEAIAELASSGMEYVAAFVDAQRDQVFGGLFRRDGSGLHLVDQELVIAPQEFVDFVRERAPSGHVAWISLDPEKIATLDSWSEIAKAGDTMQSSEKVLAPVIGEIGLQRAREGRLTDALSLDAEYVRRSDAEIFWKGGARRGV